MTRRDIDRRDCLAGLGIIASAPLLTLTAAAQAAFDAVVVKGPTSASVRAFASLQHAIDSAPAAGSRPYRILVGRGRWHEKLVVSKPNVHLIGEHRRDSRITFAAAAGDLSPAGEPWGTFGCASVIVRAPGFAANNLTIANDFNYLANLGKSDGDPAKLKDPQGVALMLDVGADRTLIRDVDLVGHQDTLFLDAGIAYIHRCNIEGSVDFVFGSGRALIDDCRVLSKFRPGKPRQGYIAAPSTRSSQPIGLVFADCRLTKEQRVPPGSVVLGRPWRPTRPYRDGRYGDLDAVGSATFLRCWMDDHIDAEGWDHMGYTAKNGERVFLEPSAARLAEFDSRGPGARSDPRRPQLSMTDASRLTRETVLAGWRP
jgi:pectinesterase